MANPSTMYNVQPQFGDTGTLTAHGPTDPANGFLGLGGPNTRRTDANGGDPKLVPLHDNQEKHFSAFRGDLVFEHVGLTNYNSGNLVRTEVVATANGVDPNKFTKDYAYRGVCVAQAVFNPIKPAAVAFTMRAKMSQKNTGVEDIHVGDEIEFYAKPLHEAKEWMAKHRTKRVPLGLRRARPHNRAARAHWGGIMKLDAKELKEKITPSRTSVMRYGADAELYNQLRQIRGNVIGTALSSAAPGANFDILLKPPV